MNIIEFITTFWAVGIGALLGYIIGSFFGMRSMVEGIKTLFKKDEEEPKDEIDKVKAELDKEIEEKEEKNEPIL